MELQDETPVLDFQNYNINIQTEDIADGDIQPLAQELFTALKQTGYCYIKNHGIPKHQIADIFSSSKLFFELEESDKAQYSRTNGLRNHGYVCIGRERLDPSKPIDLKGAFNYTPMDPGEWPAKEVPCMEESFINLYNSFRSLSYNVLDVLSLALGFEDRDFFRKYHKGMDGADNPSTLRALHYPPLPATDVKEGQLRCTEHVDYRVLSFLIQDQNGGLEVCNRDGKYIRLKPDPDCICIIIGNILQRFTSDKLLATKHRVRIPEDEVLKQKTRQSLAFFLHPDNDVIIKCLDGSDVYKPISSIDYLAWRFNKYFKEDTITSSDIVCAKEYGGGSLPEVFTKLSLKSKPGL